TTRFKEFGAYHGKRYSIGTVWAPWVSGNGSRFSEYYTDFRAYGHLTRRSLFAWRLYSAISESTGFAGLDGSTIFSVGGFNQSRGYDFREFFGNRVAFTNLELRFPLIDELRFPFGSIQMLRGFLFMDVGSGWFQGDQFFDPHTGGPDITYQGLFLLQDNPKPPPGVIEVPRKFDCWDSGNGMLGDCRGSWGIGFAWFLGPFELTWTWAKRFENSIVVGRDTDGNGIANFFERIPDPAFKSGVQTSFYIGT